jgi:hypothetical protein
MTDVAILASQVQATPNGYTVRGGQEIQVKSVRASYDGSGAGGSFVPVLQLVAPGGVIVSEWPFGSALSAGATADLSWFPGVGGSSSSLNAEYEIKVVPDNTVVVVADGQFIFATPADLNGAVLIAAAGYVTTVSSGGGLTVQVRNATAAVDMLSTAITIDVNVATSYASATQPVVNASNAKVATGQLIAVDVDAAGTNAQGLGAILTFA